MSGGTYSIEALGAKLASDVKSIVEGEVYEICLTALRNAINATVYAGAGSQFYVRTGEIMQAVNIVEKSSSATHVSFKVIVDPSKMSVDIRDGLNAHASVHGSDFRQGLIESLEDGSSGSPIFNHPAHQFYGKAADELDSNVYLIIANALSARGWDVTTL